MKYIKNGKIITKNNILKNHVLGFENVFCEIISEKEFTKSDCDIIDAENLYIVPGLIDVHIHGYGGYDTMNGTEIALETISREIAKNGVTSFLPTTMTMSYDKISRALVQIRKAMNKELAGAEIIGAHLEGPFLNRKFKGAQPEESIVEADWEFIKDFFDVIKIITIAPEMAGAIEFISKLKNEKIIVALGHSGATFEQAIEGMEAGATHITHLFNAMSGVHHRTPGLATAALARDVYCEIIADKIHVHTGVFQLLKNAKNMDKIILITDCIEAGGMPDGAYTLGGQNVVVKDNSARLYDGTLSGSILDLNIAICNFYRNTDATLWEAVNMASLNPAIELGIDDKKGSIEISKDADFFLMDEEFQVKATYIKGKLVYENEKYK